MSVTVQAKDAKLRTLQVTIESLTVEGKQMTLAVFRQLPSMDIEDREGKLVPEVRLWGLVRYQIKDEGGLWVVAEKGGILYRAAMPALPHMYYTQREVEKAEAARNKHKGGTTREENWFHEAEQDLEKAERGERPSFALFDFYGFSQDAIIEEARRRLEEHRTAWTKSVLSLGDAEEGLERARYKLRQVQEYSANIEALRKVLQGLPQLFIAV